jgi:tetratricopeptide (TPR) repeat protein
MRRLRLFVTAICILIGSHALAGDATQSLLEQSYQQSSAGDLDAALNTLQEAVEKAPDSSLVHTRLGGVRVLRQEYDAGIKHFQRAIMLDQRNAVAFIGMAVAYLHLGQYSLARAALDEAGRLDPSKQAQIDRVLSWIDQRTGGMNGSVH